MYGEVIGREFLAWLENINNELYIILCNTEGEQYKCSFIRSI